MERLTERAEIDKCPGIWVKEGFANEGNKTWFNGYDEGYSAINKCADYEDLEEQSKLLKLPCAVGDTVYVLRLDNAAYMINNEKVWEIVEDKFEIFHFDSIGKTVFLTREEAEAALKEL
ncbi:hypothetical protein E5357_06200 [Hominisplanchenecus murintestinalis]|uniref:Uncharacterized protein n=1 Tax=Hominisplanchenecus murintestinalis TaxID=2941517 RepID=A0AC61R0S6_9FIRM|nr:hypothetical protein [Hominisplanchenecus murintestinalis]TGX99198.1 hypothetical protein E5357_06200 [Hominisplanchenecus murintestinalis]